MDAVAGTRILPPPTAEVAAPRPLDAYGQHVLDRAISQFEALFVGLLLREALEGEGLVGEGPGREVLRGMVEDTLSTQISKTGAFGIGKQLRLGLIRNPLQKEENHQ